MPRVISAKVKGPDVNVTTRGKLGPRRLHPSLTRCRRVRRLGRRARTVSGLPRCHQDAPGFRTTAGRASPPVSTDGDEFSPLSHGNERRETRAPPAVVNLLSEPGRERVIIVDTSGIAMPEIRARDYLTAAPNNSPLKLG